MVTRGEWRARRARFQGDRQSLALSDHMTLPFDCSKSILRRDPLSHFQKKGETECLETHDNEKQTKDGRMRNLEQFEVRVEITVNKSTEENAACTNASRRNEHAA